MVLKWINGLWKNHSKKVKVILLLYIVGFTIGTITHTIDIFKGGFLPYSNAPLWKNIFWTSLTLLDFLAIVLIIQSIIPALMLSNLIVISDVVVNSLGVRLQNLTDVGSNYRLHLQMLFCIFIIITTPLILKEYQVNQKAKR